MRLRPYQHEAIEAAVACWGSGERRAIAVLATGLGKTVIAAFLAKRKAEEGRVKFLAHRDELIRQAVEKIEVCSDIRPAVEKADEYADSEEMYGKSRIVVGSFQTLAHTNLKRAKTFAPEEFSLIIVDEVAHLPAKTFTAVVEHYMQNPNCMFLGITATPDRADKKKLHGKVCFEYRLNNAIPDGYLVPGICRRYRVEGLDFSRVRTIGGDLAEADLAQIIQEEVVLHGIVCAAIEAAYDLPKYTMGQCANPADLAPLIDGRRARSTIIFVPGRESVEDKKLTELTADILNRWIPGCARPLDGDMDADIRQATGKDFKRGVFPFLTSVLVASEGWDAPIVSCIVMARPTKSRALYEQFYGRATRPAAEIADAISDTETAEDRRAMIAASSKPNMLVIDLVGNSGKHKLVSAAHLFTTCGSEAVVVDEDAEDSDPMQEAQVADELFSDFDDATAKVAQVNLDREDDLVAKAIKKADKEAKESESLAVRRGVVANADLEWVEFDALDGPKALADPEESRHGLSVRQSDLHKKLVGIGVDPMVADKYSVNQGWTVLNKMRKVKCTIAQARYLKGRWGYSDDEISRMNCQVASECIEANKAGRPFEVNSRQR